MKLLQRGPGSKLVSAVAEHGLRYAYHLLREGTALHQGRRADMRPHLLARLSLAGAQPGSRVRTVLEGLGRTNVAELDFELLEHKGESAAQLFAQLRLSEITDLYAYFRYFGDFRSANWLRIRVLEAHLREQARVEHVMPTALAAALEQARPDLIVEIVRSKRTLAQDRVAIDDLAGMAHALRGEIDQAERLWSRSFGAQDRAFGSDVRGRTLAVVGPAPSVEDLAHEIDSSDLVVRTNYLGKLDPRHGSRTDISYYNGVRLRTRSEQIRAVASRLSWLVSVRADDRQLRQVVLDHPRVRGGHKAARMFVSANPLGIPSILIDLLRFVPKRIKLFGADFFTAPSAYAKEYHAHVVGSDAISHSIRVHECFSSFQLVQQLKRAGFCEGDGRVEQVLGMSREQYAARLQEVHGHCTVANENPQTKWHAKTAQR